MLLICRKYCAINTLKTLYSSFRYKSAFTMGLPDMEGVFVRSVPDEDRMQICVNYRFDGGTCRTFNMNRSKIEEIGQTLTRLKATILKKLVSKKKRKQLESTEQEPDLKMWLTVKDTVIENEKMPINEIFVEGAVLHIENQILPVEVNVPKILTLVLPQNIMAGFPIYPRIHAEFCDLQNSSFEWFRLKTVEMEVEGASNKKKIKEICEKMADTFSYTPSVSEIGFKLKVTCKPKLGLREGGELTVISKCDVEAGPGICPFENRHLYTQTALEDDGVRVVTYNILADIYADSDFSRKELFPYCPPYALAIDYRKQLLIKEITGYNADVICLQEVDRKVFTNDLLPAFDILGYDGSLQVKGGTVAEGEIILYRKSKFRHIEDHSIILRNLINEDEKYSDIKDKITSNDTLKQEMDERSTIVQVIVLESLVNPGCRLCVANTHLFFHPKACLIRTLQTVTIIRHLEQIIKQQTSQGYRTSLIFCGDFNCTPRGGAYEFITTKTIGPDNYSWDQNPDKAIEGMHFSHGLDLQSGCGVVEYTNYAKNFSEQLDYIFIDQSLEVMNIIPNPEHAEVEQHIALPSVVFPSDHIAQICDLKWKNISE